MEKLEMKNRTPRQDFIAKLYAALCEFEDTTGVEIYAIHILNRRKEHFGSEGKIAFCCDFELEMK